MHRVKRAGHSLGRGTAATGQSLDKGTPIHAYAECHDWHWDLKEDERAVLAAKIA